MALYYAKPLLGSTVVTYGLAALLMGAAGTVLFNRALRANLRWALAVGVAAVGLIVWGVSSESAGATPNWVSYTTSALERAKAEGKPVLIDFYADWCRPCKELDVVTFSHAGVRAAATRIVMVKADVTLESSEASRDGLARFAVEGVPTVVFLDVEGREQKELRLSSFVGPAEMLKRIRALEATER